MFIIRRFKVCPGQVGFVFRESGEPRRLPAGTWYFLDPLRHCHFVRLPDHPQFYRAPGQEVLSADGVTLRFSFSVTWRISDHALFLTRFDLSVPEAVLVTRAQEQIHDRCQAALRDGISRTPAEALIAGRAALEQGALESIRAAAATLGCSIDGVSVIDIGFPKNIQELLAGDLETRIRARTALENARTQVAAARALKNAAALMREDPELRFLHWLETVSRIASRGRHTFVLGGSPAGFAAEESSTTSEHSSAGGGTPGV